VIHTCASNIEQGGHASEDTLPSDRIASCSGAATTRQHFWRRSVQAKGAKSTERSNFDAAGFGRKQNGLGSFYFRATQTFAGHALLLCKRQGRARQQTTARTAHGTKSTEALSPAKMLQDHRWRPRLSATLTLSIVAHRLHANQTSSTTRQCITRGAARSRLLLFRGKVEARKIKRGPARQAR